MNLGQRICLMVSVGLMMAVQSRAHFARPEDVPVSRLLAKAEVALKANPQSAEAHYLVARIHYLTFVRGLPTVPAYLWGNEDRPRIPPEWMVKSWVEDARWTRARELALAETGGKVGDLSPEKARTLETATERHLKQLQEQNWRPGPIQSQVERSGHAVAALAAFREAVRLAPKDALMALGQACLLEQIADWKRPDQPTMLPAELAGIGYTQAREAYLRAYRMAWEDDAKSKYRPAAGGLEALVSHEAGTGFLRLLEREGAAAPKSDLALRPEIEAGLKRLEKIPWGAITPIIFALRPVDGIGTLLAQEAAVDFDLRGYGPAARWPWVRPETALLVWDPPRSGAITSGRQLFGGYTFQIFRANGYDALAALDDDGDGVLRGKELQGIRAWFDRNGDGVSSPEEVVDLELLGIAGLAMRATGHEGVHPINPAGVIFADGRTLPTWDWMAEPVRD